MRGGPTPGFMTQFTRSSVGGEVLRISNIKKMAQKKLDGSRELF
jgi:hypothetical protein